MLSSNLGAFTRSPCRRGPCPCATAGWFEESTKIHPAAHWASWADALAMIHQRHPAIVDNIVGALKNAESDSIRCLLDCTRRLAETGFEVLDWTDLARDEGEDGPCQPKIGWQKQAANSVKECFFSNTVWSSLGDSERALCPFTMWSSGECPVRLFPIEPFRLLYLRRLRLPLPLCLRSCRCGRLLDTFGHHRAACANARVLGRRGWALESCCEAGARVRTNTFIRDMDLGMHDTLDGRRLEVADGLPLPRSPAHC